MTLIATNRQYQLTAVQDLVAADIAATAISAITVEVPPGAIITGGGVLVVTPSNGAGVAVLDVGTTGGSGTAFISDADLKTAGYTAFETGVGTYFPNGGTLNVTPALNTDDTASVVELIVHYVVVGRGNEVQ